MYKIQKVYIYIDSFKYEFDSAIRAFDIFFKSFFVFNLQYPEQATSFWHFIQLYFFNIKTRLDKKNTSVKLLIRELNLNETG